MDWSFWIDWSFSVGNSNDIGWWTVRCEYKENRFINIACALSWLLFCRNVWRLIRSIFLFLSNRITKHRWTFPMYYMHTSTNYTPLTYTYIWTWWKIDPFCMYLWKEKGKVSIIICWGHYVGRHLSNVKSFQFLQQKKFVLIINNNQTLSVMAFTQNKFFSIGKINWME